MDMGRRNILSCIVTLTVLCSFLVPTIVVPIAHSAGAQKKVCKYVKKKVHGKAKRVKVCKTVKATPKPTATVSPTPTPLATVDARQIAANSTYDPASLTLRAAAMFVPDSGAQYKPLVVNCAVDVNLAAILPGVGGTIPLTDVHALIDNQRTTVTTTAAGFHLVPAAPGTCRIGFTGGPLLTIEIMNVPPAMIPTGTIAPFTVTLNYSGANVTGISVEIPVTPSPITGDTEIRTGEIYVEYETVDETDRKTDYKYAEILVADNRWAAEQRFAEHSLGLPTGCVSRVFAADVKSLDIVCELPSAGRFDIKGTSIKTMALFTSVLFHSPAKWIVAMFPESKRFLPILESATDVFTPTSVPILTGSCAGITFKSQFLGNFLFNADGSVTLLFENGVTLSGTLKPDGTGHLATSPAEKGSVTPFPLLDSDYDLFMNPHGEGTASEVATVNGCTIKDAFSFKPLAGSNFPNLPAITSDGTSMTVKLAPGLNLVPNVTMGALLVPPELNALTYDPISGWLDWTKEIPVDGKVWIFDSTAEIGKQWQFVRDPNSIPPRSRDRSSMQTKT